MTQSTLERRLGPLDGAAIIVSNVIGGTILFAPPFMASLVPNPWMYLGLWVAGGALAFAGAMAYAELAALRPKAGGEYVYLDAAYGRVAAFLTGWTSFVAGFSGAIAANAFFIPIYLARFIPGVDNSTPIFTVPIPYVPLTLSTHTLVAVASVWLLALIHIRGVGPGRVAMNVLAALKVTAFMLFVLAGFAFGTGAFCNVSASGGTVSTANWLFAFIPVMLAYSGWNASAYVAEEIRDPGRNLPRSLAIGTLAVIAVYLGINLLYLFVFNHRAGGVEGQRARRGRRSPARLRRRPRDGPGPDRQPDGEQQRDDLRGAACLLCDGARQGVFQRRGKCTRPTGRRRSDHRADSVGIAADPDRQRQRAAHLHRFLDHAVPRRRRLRAVRPAPARTERRASVQGAGLSGGTGHLHDRVLRHSRHRSLHGPGQAHEEGTAVGPSAWGSWSSDSDCRSTTSLRAGNEG